MKNKFVYVYGESSRDIMLSNEYKILKSDTRNNIYVFENKSEQSPLPDDVDYVFSDTLTF